MNRPPSPPPELPGFEFVELLGRGGFADVFRYTQLGLGRSVAVKVMLSDIDPALQASFESEASVMAQLSNHPSIVSIYQAGVTTDGRPFLVMEHCPPPHLALRLRAKPLTVAKALEITIQLAGAVETAHRLGILHRDIKPANILFTEFGRPALTDFGISVTTASGEAGQGVGMSVPWAPPEQLAVGTPMGPTGDVYALAATLWTALTGRSPFHVQGGANEPVAMAARVRSMPPPPTRRPDVPESLERALQTAMAKSPSGRYDSALAFARALQGIQAELHQSVTTIDVLDEQVVEQVDDEDGGGTRFSGFVSIDPEAPPARPGSSAPPVAPAPSFLPASPAAAAAAPAAAWPTPLPPAPVDGTVIDPPAAHASAPSGGTASPHLVDATEVGLGESSTAAPPPPASPAPAPATGADAGARGGRAIGLLVAVVAVVAAVVGVVVWLGGWAPQATEQREEPQTRPSAVNPIGPADAAPQPQDVKVTYAQGSLRVSWTNPDPQQGDLYEVQLQADPYQQVDDPATATATPDTRLTLKVRDERCVTVRTVRGQARSEATGTCDLGAR